MTEAEIVLAALDSGDWAITRNQPISCLTDSGNARSAWTVRRQSAPYCADRRNAVRQWNGPTALEALIAAAQDLGLALIGITSHTPQEPTP